VTVDAVDVISVE